MLLRQGTLGDGLVSHFVWLDGRPKGWNSCSLIWKRAAFDLGVGKGWVRFPGHSGNGGLERGGLFSEGSVVVWV